jgi:hypothetical protein
MFWKANHADAVINAVVTGGFCEPSAMAALCLSVVDQH